MGTPTYDFYLDDSGTRFPDKQPMERRDGVDHFALGGVIVESERLSELLDPFQEFKAKYEIDYPLHSHKIRTRKKEYRWLETDQVKADGFYTELAELICDIPALVMACCVHRPGYNKRYYELYGNEPWKLCKSAYSIAVERAAKFVKQRGRRLIVYVEETGKREDRDIRSYHKEMIESGMYFDVGRSGRYNPMSSFDLSAVLMKNPQFVKKSNLAAQISDLVLYPLIKGKYDPTYPPYQSLVKAKRIIDCVLSEGDREMLGVKYYCFD